MLDLTKRYVTELSSGLRREAALEDYKAAAKDLALAGGVDPLVARAYGRAVRLQYYAWFEPDFSEVAELESLRALEFCLKERHRALGGDAPRGLRRLLSAAVEHGWLRDSPELREARFARLSGLDFLEAVGSTWPDETAFEEIVNWLQGYRNELAHGSQIHGPGGFAALRIVRQIIISISRDSTAAS